MLTAAAVAASLVSAVAWFALVPGDRPVAVAARPPNVVLIVADDQDVGSLADMAFVHSGLVGSGLRFEHAFASSPVCSPSRASILRGEYAHNHGVLTNSPFGGGARAFRSLGRESSTLATWLQSAGYETFFAGKYLNGYQHDGEGAAAADVPPGWSQWFAVLEPVAYLDYRLNENGTVVAHDGGPGDYLTDVLAEKALDFLRSRSQDSPPFLMLLAPLAPHGVRPGRMPVPAARDAHAFAERRAPRGGSFDEADVSDKPRPVRRRKRLSERAVSKLDEEYRMRLRSLLAVDRLVERLFDELSRRSELERTYVFYTSDNGYHLGQHRGARGKGSPYEEDIRVPLVVRGPGVPVGVREQLVLLSDLAPTIAELARAEPPEEIDARSLVPVLRDADAPGRRVLPIQLWWTKPGAGSHWRGIRTASHKFVEWQKAGELEFYDLRSDPDELTNRAAGPPDPLMASLAARLGLLVGCRGAECRRLEDAPLDGPESPTGP